MYDMQVIKVLVPIVGIFPLDYSTETAYQVGDLVVVPFRNKEITAIVWEVNCPKSTRVLKSVISKCLFAPRLSVSTLLMIKRASGYYLTELGTVAKLVLPVDVNELPMKIKEQVINFDHSLPSMSPEQAEVLAQIENSKIPVLVKGVTGSGKTEIYFHAIMNYLKSGKQVLIMLPEISLSKQIISRFTHRFAFEPVIWNSRVSKAQKKRILRGVIIGTVKVVIGARSALFLPYKDLGIIVVDEEHDSSYKQSEGILYNARDMAVLRGSIEASQTLLVSATPSIESLYNSQINKYKLIELSNRYNEAILPEIQIVDMRQESLPKNTWLSAPVINEIKSTIGKKQQALIFLNRKGYAPLMLCKTCGYRANCKSCSASMVFHKETNRLECHHCGSVASIPSCCPDCTQSESLVLCGPGIERIGEEIIRLFPSSKTVVVSKDQSSFDGQMQELLKAMEEGEIDILIGTQVITKGYHFPKLTLVVVVDADVGFVGGDLRASERTFQLLNQVGGRAGRENIKGKVMLQTYVPEHKVIDAFVNNKESNFFEEELESRKNALMPPFAKIAAITITGNNPTKTKEMARKFLSFAPRSSARILGPAEAAIYKLSGKYRYKILVIALKDFNLQKYLKLWKDTASIPSSFQIKIDIDPQSLL